MSANRFELVKQALAKKPVEPQDPKKKVSEYYGELVFDRKKMREYLDDATFQAFTDCIEGGHPLDMKTADGVAKGMKTWAIEHGVTHVTHWFQPLTEGEVVLCKEANAIEAPYKKAVAYHAIAESLEVLRVPIDKLEEIVDNKLWPLPKYRELLFIN